MQEAEEASRAIVEKEEEMRRAAEERRQLNEELQLARVKQEEAASEILRLSHLPQEMREEVRQEVRQELREEVRKELTTEVHYVHAEPEADQDEMPNGGPTRK